MKLIELGANQESFKKICFNPVGVSIIVGKRSDSVDTSTYNGVGKSLALFLIQFCLGHRKNSVLSKKLPDWEFYLMFSIEGVVYTSRRSTKNQSVIHLNERELKVSEFSEKLLAMVFKVPEGVQKASFRSLISRFLRTRKEEYQSFDRYVFKEQEERALLSNSILLGLDADRVEKKFLLKEEKNKLENLRRSIQSDETFNSYFGTKDNPALVVREIEERVQRLQKNINSFEIAEDYQEVESVVEELSYQQRELGNAIGILNERLKNVIKSLKVKSDMPEGTLENFLSKVQEELGVSIGPKIKSVRNFHHELNEGRVDRLTKESRRLEESIAEKKENLKSLSDEYNRNLKYLSGYGALDDFVAMNQKLVDEKTALGKVKSSIELIDRYKKREKEIQVTMASDDLETEEYLIRERDNVLSDLMNKYRDLTGMFYDDKKGGIVISNNGGLNKIRYNIEARIQDDSSDGINEVRIFCFDMLLLTLQKNHIVKFLFHDSRLFADMDTHQRFAALKIANDLVEHDMQYIVSMNQDTLDILREERTEEEYTRVVEQNIVLELNGDSPEGRLLGIHVDLDYL